MTKKDEFSDLFAAEHELSPITTANPWRLLLVDDEPDIHAMLRLSLQNVEVEGRPLELLEAHSAEQAKLVLSQQTNIALILLDVVMEFESSGLDLVQFIREDIQNHSVQIILVTGQPGYAPQHEVIQNFDINGYHLKTELTNEKIFASVYTSLRAFKVIQELEQKQIQLEYSEKRYFDLYEHSPDMYLSVDADTAKVRECNQTFSDKLGYKKSRIIGSLIFDLFHPDSLPDAKNAVKLFIKTGEVNNADFQLKHKDGDKIDVNVIATSVRDDNNRIRYSRLCLVDITERKKMEKDLQLAANVFTHASEGIAITDSSGNILDTNEAFTMITGYTREEVLGENPRILQSGIHDQLYYESMWHDIQEKGHWTGEIWNRRKNGEVIAEILNINAVNNAQDETQYYVGLFYDITVQKEQQKTLEHFAHYDALTNLPNRVLLSDRLEQAMAQEKRRDQKLAVIYLDLDKFKEVNDKYGHEVGDQVLIAISIRLKEILRNGDTIARIGGDEFIIILNDLTVISDYVPLLERLVHAAAMPVYIKNNVLTVSASLGVTFYPQSDPIDADQLFRQADQAMYKAKQSGKNRFQFFDLEQDRSARGHQESLKRIHQALKNDEFVLYYQPKVNMCSGKVEGMEALIRWQHPERGLLAPAEFLPIIEQDPLAILVDKWVIEKAVTQLSDWKKMTDFVPISINIGSMYLEQPGFVQYLESILKETPLLDDNDIELEILESSALNDISLVSKVIQECKQLGVSFALDDFGTGYSSLNYLKRLPSTTLKIDQSLVSDMFVEADNLTIIEGIIGLAQAFKLKVIAEGVESKAHAEKLVKMGCEIGQGYAFARPMPADKLLKWKKHWKLSL